MMTVQELAERLEEDGKNHKRKGVRRRCTPERCRRVAERALANRGADSHTIVEMCASEEPVDSRVKPNAKVDQNGYGFAWIALLLPLLQIVLQFLAQRALAHLNSNAMEIDTKN